MQLLGAGSADASRRSGDQCPPRSVAHGCSHLPADPDSPADKPAIEIVCPAPRRASRTTRLAGHRRRDRRPRNVVGHPPPEHAKRLKAVTEFGTYIRATACSIPDYGERYRAGEGISSAFVESAVNQVIAKRMVNKQQMRWTPAVPTCCSRSAPGSSTTTWPTTSAAGISASPTPNPSRRSLPRLRSLPRFFPLSLHGQPPRER